MENGNAMSVKWYWLAILVCVGFLFYLLAPVLTPFLTAALLAYLGDPIVDRLELQKITRTWSVIIVFVLIFSLAIILPIVIVPILEQQISALLVKLPVYIDWLQLQINSKLGLLFGQDSVGVSGETVKVAIGKHWEQLGGFAAQFVNTLSQSSLILVGFLVNLMLIPVVTFYLLRDWDILVAKIHDLIPRYYEKQISQIAKESDAVLGEFLRGQLSVMVALGGVYAIGLSLLGLDLGILIGMLAGLVSFVPYLGFIVGIVLAGLAAVMQFHDVIHLLGVVAVFSVGQVLEGMVLTPKLVGEKIGLHPVAVMFAVLAGGQLFGMMGVLLALPVAAVIMVMLRHMHKQYTGSTLYQE